MDQRGQNLLEAKVADVAPLFFFLFFFFPLSFNFVSLLCFCFCWKADGTTMEES